MEESEYMDDDPYASDSDSESSEDELELSPVSIGIVLEKDGGRVLETLLVDEGTIKRIREESKKWELKCLPFLALEGDTVFNMEQSKEIVKECDFLKTKLEDAEAREAMEGIVRMSEQCWKEGVCYLKFFGN